MLARILQSTHLLLVGSLALALALTLQSLIPAGSVRAGPAESVMEKKKRKERKRKGKG